MAYETVTKLQAAERQLRVAIRLFFERRDLVTVHTLAAAAQEVLRDLGRPHGFKSIFKDSEFVRPEYREELAKRLNEAQNFFKHADRDRDEELKFYHETTKFYLFDASFLYNQITGRQIREIAVLQMWFVAKYPDLIEGTPLQDPIANLAKNTDLDDYDLFLRLMDLSSK